MEFLDIPQRKTLNDLGLDSFGQSPLVFSGSEMNMKAQTMGAAGLPSNFMQDGELITMLRVAGTIYVNDGTNDRVLIGYGKGLF